jgi:hypothetical protein
LANLHVSFFRSKTVGQSNFAKWDSDADCRFHPCESRDRQSKIEIQRFPGRQVEDMKRQEKMITTYDYDKPFMPAWLFCFP